MLIPGGSFGFRSFARFDMPPAWRFRLSGTGECRHRTTKVPPQIPGAGLLIVLRTEEYLADSTRGEARLNGIRDLLEREHSGDRQCQLP